MLHEARTTELVDIGVLMHRGSVAEAALSSGIARQRRPRTRKRWCSYSSRFCRECNNRPVRCPEAATATATYQVWVNYSIPLKVVLTREYALVMSSVVFLVFLSETLTDWTLPSICLCPFTWRPRFELNDTLTLPCVYLSSSIYCGINIVCCNLSYTRQGTWRLGGCPLSVVER